MIELTKIERDVLKQLIESQKVNCEFVEVQIKGVNIVHVYQACEVLENLKLIESANTMSKVICRVTERGLDFFDNEEKEKYGNFYEEIKLIEGFINEADNLLKIKNNQSIKEFINQMFCFCKDELFSFNDPILKNYWKYELYLDKQLYYLKLTKQALLSKSLKLKRQANESKSPNIHIENNNYNNNSNDVSQMVNISIQNVYDIINKETTISENDKKELVEELKEVFSEKNKKSMWTRFSSFLGKCAERGVQAFENIAVGTLTNLLKQDVQ